MDTTPNPPNPPKLPRDPTRPIGGAWIFTVADRHGRLYTAHTRTLVKAIWIYLTGRSNNGFHASELVYVEFQSLDEIADEVLAQRKAEVRRGVNLVEVPDGLIEDLTARAHAYQGDPYVPPREVPKRPAKALKPLRRAIRADIENRSRSVSNPVVMPPEWLDSFNASDRQTKMQMLDELPRSAECHGRREPRFTLIDGGKA